MRERGLTNVGNLDFSGASRWSASGSFRVGEFSTGELGKFQPALTSGLKQLWGATKPDAVN